VNAQDLLLAIQEQLDGVEWTPDTLEAVAALMIKGGYVIRDMHDDQPLVIEPDHPERRPGHCRDCGTRYLTHSCGCNYCPGCWISCPRCGGHRKDGRA
jgi:hypothetical protein